MEEREKVQQVASSLVVSLGRDQEPEPQVVPGADPLEWMGGTSVAVGEQDVWVVRVAKPVLTESGVVMGVDEVRGPSESAVGVLVLQGKRRRGDDSSEKEEEVVDNERGRVVVVPTFKM